MFGLSSASTRLIVMALAVVLFVLAIVLGVRSCDKRRAAGAQAKVNTAQSGAFANSAGDAVNTVSTVGQNEAASDATTRANERTIRDAPGSTDKVNPALRDSGFASLCKRPSFRDSPTGRLRCPHS